MDQSLKTLLAMDDMAARHGCGLNPKLRAALEADLRFPAKAASPCPADTDPETLRARGVHVLQPQADERERSRA